MHRADIGRLISWGLRIVVGLAFAVAALLKMSAPGAFAEQVGNYQLFPELANLIALLLPSIELTCAVALVVSPKYWREAAATVLLGLLVVFTTAIGRAWAMGINLECGCFGAGSTNIGLWPILRNVGLMSALVVGYWLDLHTGSVGVESTMPHDE